MFRQLNIVSETTPLPSDRVRPDAPQDGCQETQRSQ